MANAIVTINIMPITTDVSITDLEKAAKEHITSFAGKGETKTEIVPIAFGLRALKITFVMDESLGSPDVVAEKIAGMKEVNSAEIVDVRRAVG